ncbi:hypothetical protein DPMN_015258 [Dreissena polymorpha]|uniref:Uncharacterized protein n=1 Tax=Dreissena polymorpha TaxID=45954 RepID=A0A9D4NCG9_DREPO|nr:hypothetical protein DPMN_015258 [Dreissena polymorpha]
MTIANRSSSRRDVVGIVSAYPSAGHGFVIRCRSVLYIYPKIPSNGSTQETDSREIQCAVGFR